MEINSQFFFPEFNLTLLKESHNAIVWLNCEIFSKCLSLVLLTENNHVSSTVIPFSLVLLSISSFHYYGGLGGIEEVAGGCISV